MFTAPQKGSLFVDKRNMVELQGCFFRRLAMCFFVLAKMFTASFSVIQSRCRVQFIFQNIHFCQRVMVNHAAVCSPAPAEARAKKLPEVAPGVEFETQPDMV
ncbi:MAG: hypothetical protein NXI02_00060 [Rhodobacteraceae bacterium]|nr:hypothetical protein [Paracoccaceae bacterium]